MQSSRFIQSLFICIEILHLPTSKPLFRLKSFHILVLFYFTGRTNVLCVKCSHLEKWSCNYGLQWSMVRRSLSYYQPEALNPLGFLAQLMSSGSASSEDTSAIPADESWCPEPAGAPLSPHVQGFVKRELVKLQLFQLSSLLCYAQISSQMINYQSLFFFATFGSEAYKKLDCLQCIWMDIYPSSMDLMWNRLLFFR